MVLGYTLEGPTRFDKLFTGIASPRPKSLVDGDQRGCEGIGPEDTGDGDCRRLLERVYVKGVASPIFASWNQLCDWLKAVDGLRRAA